MTSARQSLPTDRQLLWCVPLAMALHNLEEALGFRWLATKAALPEIWLRFWDRGPGAESMFHLALAGVALAVLAVALLGNLANPRSPGARVLLVIQTLMLVNACWHVVAAAALGGYAPGVVTAVMLQGPLALALLRRAWSDHWMSRRAIVLAASILFVLHALPAVVLLAVAAGSQAVAP
jgi:hypothetical protein